MLVESLSHEEFHKLLMMVVETDVEINEKARTKTSNEMRKWLDVLDGAMDKEDFLSRYNYPFTFKQCVEELNIHPLIAGVYFRCFKDAGYTE